ncbi:MAG: CoA pyrophosphatase [Pseudomonadales bacterium]|nr:CoA pyrophosphatase [Pseudomonadales bacterium]
MIDDIRERLQAYEPAPLTEPYREPRDQAAVLLPVLEGREPELILTLRSSRLGSHGGEVAWPGGRADPEDADLLATALRETREEIGLSSRQIEVVGELRPFISKFGLLVTPFVGIVEQPVDLCPNPDELEAVFSVPISYLLADPRSSTDLIDRHGERHNVPVYHYDGFKIWGLTAMILREFLNECAGARIE